MTSRTLTRDEPATADVRSAVDAIVPRLTRPVEQHRVLWLRGRREPICGVREDILTLRVGRRWGRELAPADRSWLIAAAVARRDVPHGTELFVLSLVATLVALVATVAKVTAGALGYGHPVTNAIGEVVAGNPLLALLADRAVGVIVVAFGLSVIARLDLVWRGDRRAAELGFPIPPSVAGRRLIGYGAPGYGMAIAIAAGLAGAGLGFYGMPAAINLAVQVWLPRFDLAESTATISLGRDLGLLCGLLAARATIGLAGWLWSTVGVSGRTPREGRQDD